VQSNASTITVERHNHLAQNEDRGDQQANSEKEKHQRTNANILVLKKRSIARKSIK
jgi:hypothetical protein